MLDVLYMLDLLNATHAMLCMLELLSALSHACFTPSPLCFLKFFSEQLRRNKEKKQSTSLGVRLILLADSSWRTDKGAGLTERGDLDVGILSVEILFFPLGGASRIARTRIARIPELSV